MITIIPIPKAGMLVAVAAAVLLAMAPAPAHAEGGIVDVFTEGLSRVWSFITGAAETAGDAVSPPTPVETLRKIKGEEKGEFWTMLEDAGYELKEIETEVGIIPGIETTYILRRELSDADREALERRLELHALNNGGLISRLERAIIYSLLDASELGEYRIEKLKVKFLPLPAASFSLVPSEAPLEEEHDRIFRAVREQGRSLRHIDRESHRPAAVSPAARPISNSVVR
jgi:hypothetical protein